VSCNKTDPSSRHGVGPTTNKIATVLTRAKSNHKSQKGSTPRRTVWLTGNEFKYQEFKWCTIKVKNRKRCQRFKACWWREWTVQGSFSFSTEWTLLQRLIQLLQSYMSIICFLMVSGFSMKTKPYHYVCALSVDIIAACNRDKILRRFLTNTHFQCIGNQPVLQ
jgi:hypothetical protein